MRYSKFTVKNLFGLKEFMSSGKSMELLGDNGTNKTSVLDSFKLALTNRSPRDYIVRTGSEEGEVLIETDTGLSICRKKRTNKADYKSIRQAGEKGEKTEAHLRGIFTELQLNPMEFLSMSKDEQNRIVLDLIEFAWDLNWIKSQFGEIVPEVNYEQNILCVLHDIQADEGYYFRTRQDINREARNKSAFVEEIGVTLPDKYNAKHWEEADLGEVYRKIETIRNTNQQIEKAKSIVDNRDNKVRKFQADLEIEINTVEKTTTSARTMAEKEILKLEGLIKEQRTLLGSLEEKKIEKIKLAKAEYEKNVAEFEGEVKQFEEAAKKKIVPFSELQEEAEEIEAMKAHINEYNRMVEYQKEVEDLMCESTDLTVKIEKARTLPGEILENCKIPVEGLTVVDGLPLINGLPISNLSEGEKFNLCIDIATQGEGTLDILLIDGVEKLSEKNRLKMYKKLKKKGAQFIASRTTDDKELIVVEL